MPQVKLMSKDLHQIIEDGKTHTLIDDLPHEQRILFDFLTLIVDIQYRIQNQSSFDYNEGRGYALTDQSEVSKEEEL